MAGSVNKATIVGNLGKDPDLRNIPSGAAVCNFSVATNERYKQGDEWQSKTEWHNIVVWGKLAERCNQYLQKGSLVYVEGKMQTRKWKDRDDNDRYTSEVNAFIVVFLDKQGGRGQGGGSQDGGGDGEAPAGNSGDGGGSKDDESFPF